MTRVRGPWPLAAGLAVLATLVTCVGCAPRTLLVPLAAARPGCLFLVPLAEARRRPRVALTIDDAPDPATTPALLDTLRAHGAHATFFVITGQLPGAEGVVRRMVAEGHELGNHLTRDEPSIRLDSAAFARELAAAGAALRPYGGARWVRPGSGWYSRRMVRDIERMGARCALGSVHPFDAQLGWPPLSERWILGDVFPGAVIILHDRGARGRRTAAVLGRILPALEDQGYEVVTLGTLEGARRR